MELLHTTQPLNPSASIFLPVIETRSKMVPTKLNINSKYVRELHGYKDHRLDILSYRFKIPLHIAENGIVSISTNDTGKLKAVKAWFDEFCTRKKNRSSLLLPAAYERFFYGDTLSKSWSDPQLCWSGIGFIPKDYHGRIVGKNGCNIRKLEKEFGVLMFIEKKIGKIMIKGDLSSRRQAKSYLRYYLFAKLQFTDIWYDLNKLFIIGLENSDKIPLIKKHNCEQCEQHTEIGTLSNFNPSEGHIAVLEWLREVLLSVKKRMKTDNQAVCEVMIHRCLVHHKRDPGTYTVSKIVNDQKIAYKRLTSGSLNFDVLRRFPISKNIIRYDFHIFTPKPEMEIRYKVFIDASTVGKLNFISCEEVGENRQRFEEIRVGPGYFCAKKENIARANILDPSKNTCIRFNVQLFNANSESNAVLTKHAQNLQHCLVNLKIEDGSAIELKLNELPPGYLITYSRRAKRKAYQVGDSTILRTSSEDIFVMDGISCYLKSNDVFLHSIPMQSREWNVNEVLESFKEALNCIDYLKSIMD